MTNKIYVVEEYQGTVPADLLNTILIVKEDGNKTKYDLENLNDLEALKEKEWDSEEDAQERTTFNNLEEAKAFLEDADATTYYGSLQRWLEYNYYCLTEIEVDEDGDEINWERLDYKLGNTDLINDLRENIIWNEMKENEKYLTNLFGTDRLATKKEIMERYQDHGPKTWNEIIEDINADDEINYFIAEEDYEWEDLDEGWIAGNLYRIIDFETGERIFGETARESKVNFVKSGSGSYSSKVTLPAKWIRKLGITKEEREIKIELDGNEIKISKKNK